MNTLEKEKLFIESQRFFEDGPEWEDYMWYCLLDMEWEDDYVADYDAPSFKFYCRGLDLQALRGANMARLPHYGNSCDWWGLSQWSNATLGELGEAANIIKKIERGDFTLEEKREELGKEFADVLCYLDLLAMKAGVDLSEATVNKFNEISERVGSSIELHREYWIMKID